MTVLRKAHLSLAELVWASHERGISGCTLRLGEVAIKRRRVEGLRPRGLKSFALLAALAGSGALAGTAFAGGPHPDPPPKAPPPPPPVYHPPPPPPPAVVAPPPPPAYIAPPPPPVVHATVGKHVKRHVAKPKAHATPTKKPVRRSGLGRAPLLLAGAPAAAASTTGTLSPALLIVAFGFALALLAIGVSFMPASAVPFALGLRLERSRQTIMCSGLAIGAACALVGLLTTVVGR